MTMVTFTVGGQSYFFQQYHAYLNVDVSVVAAYWMDAVVCRVSAGCGRCVGAEVRRG